MKQYRAAKKTFKLDKYNYRCYKARRARNELQTLAIEQANKTADKLTEIEGGKGKRNKRKR